MRLHMKLVNSAKPQDTRQRETQLKYRDVKLSFHAVGYLHVLDQPTTCIAFSIKNIFRLFIGLVFFIENAMQVIG